MIAVRSFRFQESERGKRLDIALVGRMPAFSRAQIQRLVTQGNVTMDGVVPRKVGITLRGNEKVIVRVPPAASSEVKAEPIPLIKPSHSIITKEFYLTLKYEKKYLDKYYY